MFTGVVWCTVRLMNEAIAEKRVNCFKPRGWGRANSVNCGQCTKVRTQKTNKQKKKNRHAILYRLPFWEGEAMDEEEEQAEKKQAKEEEWIRVVLEAARGGRQHVGCLVERFQELVCACVQGTTVHVGLWRKSQGVLSTAVLRAAERLRKATGSSSVPVSRVKRNRIVEAVKALHSFNTLGPTPTDLAHQRMLSNLWHDVLCARAGRTKYTVFHFLVACMDAEVLDAVFPFLALVQALGCADIVSEAKSDQACSPVLVPHSFPSSQGERNFVLLPTPTQTLCEWMWAHTRLCLQRRVVSLCVHVCVFVGE